MLGKCWDVQEAQRNLALQFMLESSKFSPDSVEGTKDEPGHDEYMCCRPSLNAGMCTKKFLRRIFVSWFFVDF